MKSQLPANLSHTLGKVYHDCEIANPKESEA